MRGQDVGYSFFVSLALAERKDAGTAAGRGTSTRKLIHKQCGQLSYHS